LQVPEAGIPAPGREIWGRGVRGEGGVSLCGSSGRYIQLEEALAGFGGVVYEEIDDNVTCLPEL